MSKRKNKKNKRTPEQKVKMIEKRRLSMERNSILNEKDELENGERIKIERFGRYLLRVCLSHNPVNRSHPAFRRIGQSLNPVSDPVKNFVKGFKEKSEMKLLDNVGCYYLFTCEFGLIIVSDNHKKLNYTETGRLETGKVLGLEWIVTNPKVRDSGWANKILETITSISDKNKLDVVLHCSNGSDFENTLKEEFNYEKFFGVDTGSMDNNRLHKFYEKHDFDTNPFYAREYLQTGEQSLVSELMMRPSEKTKTIKFPKLFSNTIGNDVEFSYENTKKNFKKLAMVA
jgi:hypothetical protein